MEKLQFLDIYDFAETLIATKLDNTDACVFCTYEQAKELLRAIMVVDMENEYDVHSIELEHEELDGYDKEYYFDLTSDCTLWISKAYSNIHKKYLYTSCDDLFDLVGNSSGLKEIDYKQRYNVEIIESNEESASNENELEFEDCGYCFLDTQESKNEDDSGYQYGFTFSCSGDNSVSCYSFYSNDKSLVERMADKIGTKDSAF